MTDREALLRAIIDHPDEDTPRLVYADWLDENGDSKRAAFIRAQIEYHRLEAADTVVNALDFLWAGYTTEVDRVDWTAIDADLAARLTASKANEKVRFRLSERNEGTPRVKGVRFVGGDRGFFDTVTVFDPAAFVKHADAIFRAAPITSVHFMELTGAQASEFAASGHLARMRELSFGYEVEPDAVRGLGTHADAAGVRDLSIGNDDEAADTIEALAAGKHWTGLERLDVSCVQDGDEPPEEEQLARLFARPQFRNLHELSAWSACVDDTVVRSVARNLPELRTLDLSMNRITDVGTFAAAKNLRNLRSLDLSSCDLVGDPAPLITTTNLPNLGVLRLDSNQLRGLDPKVLAKPGRRPGLRVLDLGTAHLTEKGVEALVKCPALRGLWYLSLDYGDLGNEHVERFTRHAAFDRLVCLNLSGNEITAGGAKALAAWPGAVNLQWLDLVLNNIGESGAKALAASPHLTGLKYLSFNGRGSAVLKKRFKKAFA